MVGRRNQLSSSLAIAALPAIAALAACGGGRTFEPAQHQPLPQVLSLGGPVVAAPTMVPVFFTGDDATQAQVEQLDAALASSPTWSAATSEYGVGPLTFAPTIVTSDPTPATEAALDAWLVSSTDGTHPGWPTPDANTIYAVFLPSGAVFTRTSGDGLESSGFHTEATGAHGEALLYLLVENDFGIDQVTSDASVEYVDAVTDPFPSSNPAFRAVDPDHYVWSYSPGTELGEMCDRVVSDAPRLAGMFAVKRTWSNAAAAAGADPCVPALPGAIYVGATLQDVADVALDPGGGAIPTKGVEIPIGTSKTVGIAFFSTAPTNDFVVTAFSENDPIVGSDELTFSFDQDQGRNGDVMELTITRVQPGRFGGSEFSLRAESLDVGTPDSDSVWFGYVAN